MRNVILTALALVLWAGGPAAAQTATYGDVKGLDDKDAAKTLAEAARLLADERKIDAAVAWGTAEGSKLLFEAQWAQTVDKRWNDIPGKAYWNVKLSPEQYGTVLGDMICAKLYRDDADSWYTGAWNLLSASYLMYKAGQEEYAAGNYASAYTYFDYAETGYRTAAGWYATAGPIYDVGGVYLWDAQTIFNLYWVP